MTGRLPRFTVLEMFVLAVLIGAIGSLGYWQYDRARSRGYLETMKDDLRNLATAQAAYATDNAGAFMPRNPRVTSTLPYNGYAPTSDVTVTIADPTMTGWSATATHERAPGVVCGIFAGPEPPALPNPATRAGEPQCE